MKIPIPAADRKLLDEVFSDYNVEHRAAPWFKESLHAMGHLSEMIDEIKDRGKAIRDTHGFGPLLTVRKVAHYPDVLTYSVIAEVNPEILTSNEKLLAFLKTEAGQKFSLLKRRQARR